MSMRSAAQRELKSDGHEVVFDSSDDTGMAFSATNWRYWLLGTAAFLTLAGLLMGLLTAPPIGVDGGGGVFTIVMALGGLLCVGVVPGVFLLCALAASNDRAKRGSFTLTAFSAVLLSAVYVFFTGMGLAVNGTRSQRDAREAAYKQAFDTLDSYAASADQAREAFFNAGGVRVKTLIGADTISTRISLVNRLKVACAESAKLMETAEPTIDEWFESAGVSVFARAEFWEDRHGHEYTEALKNLRAVETKLTAAVSEYLRVMHGLTGRYAMADSNNVYFKDREDLETYEAALKKLDPALNAYDDAQDRVAACKALIKKQQGRGR